MLGNLIAVALGISSLLAFFSYFRPHSIPPDVSSWNKSYKGLKFHLKLSNEQRKLAGLPLVPPSEISQPLAKRKRSHSSEDQPII